MAGPGSEYDGFSPSGLGPPLDWLPVPPSPTPSLLSEVLSEVRWQRRIIVSVTPSAGPRIGLDGQQSRHVRRPFLSIRGPRPHSLSFSPRIASPHSAKRRQPSRSQQRHSHGLPDNGLPRPPHEPPNGAHRPPDKPPDGPPPRHRPRRRLPLLRGGLGPVPRRGHRPRLRAQPRREHLLHHRLCAHGRRDDMDRCPRADVDVHGGAGDGVHPRDGRSVSRPSSFPPRVSSTELR